MNDPLCGCGAGQWMLNYWGLMELQSRMNGSKKLQKPIHIIILTCIRPYITTMHLSHCKSYTHGNTSPETQKVHVCSTIFLVTPLLKLCIIREFSLAIGVKLAVEMIK